MSSVCVLSHHFVAATDESWMEVMPEAAVEPKLLVPERYSRNKTSGLTADVKEEENAIDFELTTKPARK